MPLTIGQRDQAGLHADWAADAHRRDLEVQERFGIEFRARWSAGPQDRGTSAGRPGRRRDPEGRAM
jgi:hypothetical protein